MTREGVDSGGRSSAGEEVEERLSHQANDGPDDEHPNGRQGDTDDQHRDSDEHDTEEP